MNCIEIHNLTKQYENFKLNNISFNVPQGSIVGFVGENGAGKTTTIKLILNLIKKDKGNIKIFGINNSENEIDLKQQIGIVFDESYFPDNLKVNEVSYIMKNIYTKWDNNTFNKYIDKFELPKNKIIKDYSRGMKMKMSIAVALSHNAKLLILDEATSGLDPIVRDEILEVFLDFIQNEEHSILISSHIISDLEKIADYIVFIHKGEIVFNQSKDELIYDYGVIKCNIEDFNLIDKKDIIRYKKNQFGYEILIKNKDELEKKYNHFVMDRVTIEDIMLFYIKGEQI